MSIDIRDNPILAWDERPPFEEIQANHVVPAAEAMLAEVNARLHDIEEDPPVTWEGLVPRLEQIEDLVGRIWGVVSHLTTVKNSPELREAHQNAQPQIIQFMTRFGQSQAIYDALSQIRQSAEWDRFNSGQKRIVESYLKRMNLSGIGLRNEKREKFNTLTQRMVEIQTKYRNNVLDSTNQFKLWLTTKEEIKGLPKTVLSMAAENARNHGEETSTSQDGPWLITLDVPSFLPFLQHSPHRHLREQVYTAYTTRASQGEHDNMPILIEILQIRKEQAKMLGFNNHAEVSLSVKMAGEVDAVLGLLKQLRSASHAAGKRDLDSLIAMARSQNAPEADDFRSWDLSYWTERLREQEYDLSDDELRPYFPLPRVLDGLFELSKRVFGFEVVPADGEVQVWHPDVQYFRVNNLDGEQVAALYFDPYSRPSEKRGGAWANPALQRSRILATSGQEVRLPVGYMMCNQSPPADGNPSLMTFREVETLYHEFGHCIQHMLTNVDYGQVSGLSNIEWDAVEIASQFMENWCYHRPTLRSMTGHYETGEPIPDELIDRLLKARTYQSGYQMLRQVTFGMTDMTLHTAFDPTSDNPIDIFHKIASETLILPPEPEDMFLCSFQHIFASSYAAGYYSYKWSEVISADAFAAFEEVGLDNLEEVQQLGLKYRNTILAEGGSRHPMDVYVEFRGRQPSIDALLRHTGLAA